MIMRLILVEKKGYDAYEKMYRNKSNEIYNALHDIGYYDEL